MSMTGKTTTALLLTSLLALMLSGCEVPTSVKVGAGPSFSFHGSGRLASFSVYSPQPGHKIATPFDAKSLTWSIEPLSGEFSGAWVERLRIEYGSPPSGYKQTKPNVGAALTLPSGQIYYFFAGTTGAPPAEGFFYMDRGTPVEVRVPDLCQSSFSGDVKALKCGTKEAYTEPNDLEEFARENRAK
jgi:hypothetical protein